MATKGERRSACLNKGQPTDNNGMDGEANTSKSFMQRIGEFVAGSPVNCRKTPEEERSVKSNTVKSSSVKSTSNSKKAMIDAKFEDTQERKETELFSLETQNIDLQTKVDQLQKKLKKHNISLEKLDSTEEMDQKLMTEIEKTEDEIGDLKAKIKKKEVQMRQLQNEIKRLPTQKKIVQELAVVEEDKEQDLSDDDLGLEKQNDQEVTEEWVKKNIPLKSTEAISTDEEDAALLERFRMLKGDDIQFKKKDDVNGCIDPLKQMDSTDVPKDQVADALKMIAQVLQNQQGGAGSKLTERMMIRQSTTKDLPIFNGRAEEWPAFFHDFQRTTKLCGYSDDENVGRLRKCLKGEAYKAVESLMFSPNSLDEVMDMLKTRFGQTEHIIAAMIDKTRAAPSVREGKVETLIQFGTSVINLTSTIVNLDCKSQLENLSLLHELEKKLPDTMEMNWREWVKNDIQRTRDLSYFSKWIKIKTDTACEMRPLAVKEYNERDPKKQQNWMAKVPRNSERVFAADSTDKPSVENKKVSKCFYCDKIGHRTYECSGFKGLPVEKRRDVVAQKKLCFNCLSSFHVAKDCKSTYCCRVDNCGRRHHNILHMKDKLSVEKLSVEKTSVENVNVCQEQRSSRETFVKGILGILSVQCRGPAGVQHGFALVDSGASTGLILQDLSESLGLEGEETSLCIKGINSTIESVESKTVILLISGTHRYAKEYRMSSVKTLKHMDLGPLSLDVEDLAKLYPFLDGIPLKSYKNVKPMLLIGSAHTHLTEPLRIVSGRGNEPRAYKSRLGWYVSGALQQQNRVDSQMIYHVCDSTDHFDSTDSSNSTDMLLNEMVKHSFTTEYFGVKITHDKPRLKEDQRALKLLEETTRRVEPERFETGLLWRDESTQLPQSMSVARHRLYCQERKMDKNPEFAVAYGAKMTEYEEKGFIRKLSKEEILSTDNRIWYLPHFGVLNPNTPGKLRLVFDAAAESNGMSLNKALVQGPDLNNAISAVLVKFRQYQYAFAGDIKDMFHRIMIRQNDQGSQRFLWRGMDRDRQPDVYEMQVMIFGSACSPSSAQYVKNLNAKEHSTDNLEANNAIVNKIYVDDYLDSKPTVSEACSIIKNVTEINKKASFEVCNWVSNSTDVLKTIPLNLRANDLKSLDLDESAMPTGRVLGMWWDQNEDNLTFRLNFHKVSTDVVNGSKRPTKRDVLKLVMSIYDPLGLVAHLIVKGKMIMQDLWRYGIGFDDEIPDTPNEKWKSFLEEINGLNEVRIPRCYSSRIPTATNVQLPILRC